MKFAFYPGINQPVIIEEVNELEVLVSTPDGEEYWVTLSKLENVHEA